jgi:hypothetical protein
MSEKFEAGMVCATGKSGAVFIVVWDRQVGKYRRVWVNFDGREFVLSSFICPTEIPESCVVLGKLDGEALENDITALIKGNGGTS